MSNYTKKICLQSAAGGKARVAIFFALLVGFQLHVRAENSTFHKLASIQESLAQESAIEARVNFFCDLIGWFMQHGWQVPMLSFWQINLFDYLQAQALLSGHGVQSDSQRMFLQEKIEQLIAQMQALHRSEPENVFYEKVYKTALDWRSSLLLLLSLPHDSSLILHDDEESIDQGDDLADEDVSLGLGSQAAKTEKKIKANRVARGCLKLFDPNKDVLTPILADPKAPTNNELKALWNASVTYFFWWDKVLADKRKAAADAQAKADAALAQAKSKMDAIMQNVKTANTYLKDCSTAVRDRKALLDTMNNQIQNLNQSIAQAKKNLSSGCL